MNETEQKNKKTSIESRLIEDLSSKFNTSVNHQKERRLWVSVDSSKIVEICSSAQEMGFDHLSTISVTDWLEESNFELTYHLWSYEHNVLLTIKTKVDRQNPSISSINTIWGTNSETCERECHELFGVIFEGNPNLTPLFLEDWQGPPPFLKDFNWREYVAEEMYDKENPREETYFEVKK